MRQSVHSPGRFAVVAIIGVTILIFGTLPGQTAGKGGSINNRRGLDSESEAEDESDEILGIAYSFSGVATAPGESVSAEAFVEAFADAASLPVVGGSWNELQNVRYNNDNHDYRDPFISNSGAGWGDVTGRMTGLAVMPNGTEAYAGAAGGGVWKTTNGGATWTPVFDQAAASLAVGSIAINPDDQSIWVGTGENNTAFENHKGVGVFRSDDHGASWVQVGDNVTDSTVGKLEFDGEGNLYVATSRGLFSRDASDLVSDWTKEFDATTFGYPQIPYGLSFVNDVEVKPGTDGRVVVAQMGWRSGAAYNGYYVSRDFGATWSQANLNGAINPMKVGSASMDYASDGRLYTLVESAFLINNPQIQFGGSVLDGIYVSPTGNPAGPWNRIAGFRKLQQSGSALTFLGFAPGVQAWYNQFVGVDPANPNHVYIGLEEVFETRNGGATWRAIGPYWNFGLACSATGLDDCPPTTHPDQHVVAFGGGKLWVGNDGGIYTRPLNQSMASPAGWQNRNATLRTLQYYGAGAGPVNDPENPDITSGSMVWGGMQDNGVSLLAPGLSEMVSPFGGDGGQQLVDPTDGDKTIAEYVGLDMWKTTVGGYAPADTPSDLSSINAWEELTPACGAFTYTPDPCDPLPRFIAPFTWDFDDTDHWVAGGQFVWDNGGAGWDTSCSATACDWTPVHDTGAGHSVTALSVSGDTIYAGWCAPGSGCNPAVSSETGAGFDSGIDTNEGGTWHPVADVGGVLPNRYVSAVVVDPDDAEGDHVYAAFGGFSRRWIDSAGVGHVFESTDGGEHWTDISGNLPDAPARDMILTPGGDLVLATDVGVFFADVTDHDAWSQLGGNLPHAVIDDLSLYPGGGSILAGTHGRGLWSVPTPA
jgi:photosystem II stability/assembly factor-like uncharacterized protein